MGFEKLLFSNMVVILIIFLKSSESSQFESFSGLSFSYQNNNYQIIITRILILYIFYYEFLLSIIKIIIIFKIE